jgi:hypothetical protein
MKARRQYGPDPLPAPDIDYLAPVDERLQPELLQRVYDPLAGEAITREAGVLAPRALDFLEHIVGEGDVGFVLSADHGEREGFAVVRLRDWRSIERANGL